MIPHRVWQAALAAAIMLTTAACVNASHLATLAADTPPAIGSGRYRFHILTGADGKPQPDTDFALSLTRTKRLLPFIADEKNVWRGRTDPQGHTPIFALPFRPRASEVMLRPRFGDGPFGEQFQLVDSTGDVVGGMPYRMLICSDPPQAYAGRTDADGYTVYAASDHPVSVRITTGEEMASDTEKHRSEDDLAYCQGEAGEATGQIEAETTASKSQKDLDH